MSEKRESLDRDYSEHMFTKHAQRVHPKNMLGSGSGQIGPMRGGIRL